MTEEDTTDGVAPEDAFSLVANEIRMTILRALWTADGPLSFSELRERAGVRDSGKFNYHLGELVGRFVEKGATTDGGDDAYALRYPGERIMGAVNSGALTRSTTVEAVPVAGACYECGGDLAASYEDERAEVDCQECGTVTMSFDVPPAVVEGRDPEAVPRAFDDWVRLRMELARRGFCPMCSGVTTPFHLEVPEMAEAPAELTMVGFECEQCGQVAQTVAGATLLDHPVVVAFHLDHGVDLANTRVWELDWLLEDHSTVRDEGYEVRIPLDEEVLVVRTDEGLAVRDHHHEAR